MEYKTIRQNDGRVPLQKKDLNIPGSSPISSKRKWNEKQSHVEGPNTKVSRFLNPLLLSIEQKKVLQVVLSGQNIFFTGSAGTGKSFLLKRLVGTLPPDTTFVTASTGVAACQISGTTLHSFAGIGNGEGTLERCIELASRKEVALQWRKCKHLIVDEISMVDADYFQKLEEVSRVIRKNDLPFGGIQLILCGDFLQLPPVGKKGQRKRFCFQSSAWERCVSVNLELTEIRRQDDQKFIDVLQAIRLGRCSKDVTEILKATEDNCVERNGIKATRLCTHKDDVEIINEDNLIKLTGAPRVFNSSDSDPSLSMFLDSHTPVVCQLTLKVGAQVMLMKNLDATRGLVNGARGVVVAFSVGEGFPIVKFICGEQTEVQTEKWTVRTGGGLYISRKQIPLKLAWAFSIHKSQGMTLDCAEMSLSRVFEAGQAYVALSRARNLNSIRVLDFNASCICAHPDVLEFYFKLKKLSALLKQQFLDRF